MGEGRSGQNGAGEKNHVEHDWAGVWRQERAEIEVHRPKGAPWRGLALSGGGIRSASFSLGVVQALDRFQALDRLDYVSTVSGGGYCCTALTWALRNYECFEYGKTPSPIGYRPDTRKEEERLARNGKCEGEEEIRLSNALLNFIRQNASYLMPGGGLGLAALVASAVQGLLITLFVYGTWVVLIMKGLFELERPAAPWNSATRGLPIGTWPLTAGLFVAVMLFPAALAYVFLGARARCPEEDEGSKTERQRRFKTYEYLIGSQRIIGIIWALALGLVVVGSVPLVAGLPIPSAVLPTLLSAVGGLGGVLQLLGLKASGSDRRLKLQEPLLLVAAILLIYGVLLGAYILNVQLDRTVFGQWDALSVGLAYAGLALLALAVGWRANPNYIAHHRTYRDRLMELFMPDEKAVKQGRWNMAREAEGFLLAKVKLRRPLHLINTNLVLVDDDERRFRDRGGDSFVLSPIWCGSQATGWVRSHSFNKGTGSHGMTLAAAMAISGAAMNPHTGPGGRGIMRSWPVSTMMSLLGLRLGYWIRSPGRWSQHLSLYCPGLKGLFGVGFRKKARYLELSDGGHFDNTGLYELLRRRVDHIMLADAGCDPDFKFNDLANVIERARVDFGVVIESDDEWSLAGLLPHSAPQDALEKRVLAKKFALAARGFARFKITYPRTVDGQEAQEAKEGSLLLIKTTLVPDLPADVYGYRSDNANFPHQSTGDQFFDERQFEAYRELGYQLAKMALKDPQAKAVWLS